TQEPRHGRIQDCECVRRDLMHPGPQKRITRETLHNEAHSSYREHVVRQDRAVIDTKDVEDQRGDYAGAVLACSAMKCQRMAARVADEGECVSDGAATHFEVPEIALREDRMKFCRRGDALTTFEV